MERLLTPDDFVTWRVNWTDKVENIRSIADELGFAPDAFLFIDDNPVERENVRRAACRRSRSGARIPLFSGGVCLMIRDCSCR